MSFMRLGTRIAIINDKNEILLSKRGDFGLWALPGGRVDSGEVLHESAIREVHEETGLVVEIERPIGLYYQEGRSRMNILYRAKSVGGELFTVSDETLDNRFFAPDNLPDELFGQIYIDDAYSKKTHLRTIASSRWELLKLDLKLRWRWIQNLLAGRPEPKFNQFTIRVVGLIYTSDRRALNLPEPELLRVESDGKKSLHSLLERHFMGGFYKNMGWRWVGLWQNTKTDEIEFILETTDTFVSNMTMAFDELSSDMDRKIALKAKRKSSKIWTIREE